MSWGKSFLFSSIITVIWLLIISLFTLNFITILTLFGTVLIAYLVMVLLLIITKPLWFKEFCPRCNEWVKITNNCCKKCGLRYQIVMHYGDYDSDDVASHVWDKY